MLYVLRRCLDVLFAIKHSMLYVKQHLWDTLWFIVLLCVPSVKGVVMNKILHLYVLYCVMFRERKHAVLNIPVIEHVYLLLNRLFII